MAKTPAKRTRSTAVCPDNIQSICTVEKNFSEFAIKITSKVDSAAKSMDANLQSLNKSLDGVNQRLEKVEQNLVNYSERLAKVETCSTTISESLDRLDKFLFNGDNIEDSVIAQLSSMRTEHKFFDRSLAAVVGIAASIITALIIFAMQALFFNNPAQEHSFGSETGILETAH